MIKAFYKPYPFLQLVPLPALVSESQATCLRKVEGKKLIGNTTQNTNYKNTPASLTAKLFTAHPVFMSCKAFSRASSTLKLTAPCVSEHILHFI